MADYNNGSGYGYDTIDPYDYHPLEFDLGQFNDDSRPILVSNNEIPKRDAAFPTQIDKISEHNLVRNIDSVPVREAFSDRPAHRHPPFRGVQNRIDSIFGKDTNLILLFIVIVIGILQIKTMMTLDFMMQLHMRPMSVDPYGRSGLQTASI